MQKLLGPAILLTAVLSSPAAAQVTLVTACESGDQQACVQLARSATASTEVRLAAVRKVTDQAVLAEVARTCSVRDIRLVAIRSLIDPDALASFALTAKAPTERGAAVERLRDQDLLARIARSDTSKWVRRKAANCLTDEAAITKLVAENRKELLPTVTFGGGIRRVTVDGTSVKETLLGVITVKPGRHGLTAEFSVRENVVWEEARSTPVVLDAKLGASYSLEAEVGIVTWDYISPQTRRGRGTWTLVIREELSAGPNLLPQILRR